MNCLEFKLPQGVSFLSYLWIIIYKFCVCTISHTLFALSQYKGFDRSLAKISKDLFDCLMFVSVVK